MPVTTEYRPSQRHAGSPRKRRASTKAAMGSAVKTSAPMIACTVPGMVVTT